MWDRKGGFLLFSDPNSNTIYKYSPDGNGTLTVFREKSGYEGADIAEYGQPGSNGLTFDQQGRLTINQHGNRRVVRVESRWQLTVLADKFEGKRLNSPNDLVYRSDGTLYFTDPPFGLPKFFNDPRKELPFSGVFAVKDGNVKLVTKDFTGPNGIAFSPDEKYLLCRGLGREEESRDALRSTTRRFAQEWQSLFRYDEGAGRKTLSMESRSTRQATFTSPVRAVCGSFRRKANISERSFRRSIRIISPGATPMGKLSTSARGADFTGSNSTSKA